MHDVDIEAFERAAGQAQADPSRVRVLDDLRGQADDRCTGAYSMRNAIPLLTLLAGDVS